MPVRDDCGWSSRHAKEAGLDGLPSTGEDRWLLIALLIGVESDGLTRSREGAKKISHR